MKGELPDFGTNESEEPPLPEATVERRPTPKKRLPLGPNLKRKCPRCGLFDTVATSTRDNVQHRLCRRPICRYRFKVVT